MFMHLYECTCVHTCVEARGTQVNLGCCLQDGQLVSVLFVFFYLFFEIRSLTRIWACGLGHIEWPVSSRNPPVSTSSAWKCEHILCPAFCISPGVLTEVAMLV